MNLSDAVKEEVALALILWRDFKSQGKYDIEIAKQMIELARHLGVSGQLDDLLLQVPPMKIEPRYPPQAESIPGE